MASVVNQGVGVLGLKQQGTGTNYSSAIEMRSNNKLSVQLINDGIVTGTASLEASLDKVNWVAVANSASAFTANTGYLIEVDNACSCFYRCKVVTTAASAVAASGTITGSVGVLDIVADTAGLAGNAIQLILVGGGTAGSETVTVVGSIITVDIESGVSTVAQVKTALEADVNAAALVDLTATTAGALEEASVTLSGGSDGKSDLVVLAYTK